ncbi:unnamed protein product [Cuscuta europaea]|uniref:Uncharacterized protein n=1 Tax=Cuscuta europaea TaxID=41803 RepID=A0A9P1E310_CUSEU|nr:unnamed protein product [Cuscuta europaea]
MRRGNRGEIGVGKHDGLLSHPLYGGYVSDFPHIKRLCPLLSLANGVSPRVAPANHEDVAFLLLVLVVLLLLIEIPDLLFLTLRVTEGNGVWVNPSICPRRRS